MAWAQGYPIVARSSGSARFASAAMGARALRVRAELADVRAFDIEGLRTSKVLCNETLLGEAPRRIRFSSRRKPSGLIPIISHRLRKAKMLYRLGELIQSRASANS